MMITGQPGIGALAKHLLVNVFFKSVLILHPGKRFCLIYLLVRRILKGQPTFYQIGDMLIYLFCKQGVFLFSPTGRFWNIRRHV